MPGPHGPDDVPPTGASAPEPSLVQRIEEASARPDDDVRRALEGDPDTPPGVGRVSARAATYGRSDPLPGGIQPDMTDLAPETDQAPAGAPEADEGDEVGR